MKFELSLLKVAPGLLGAFFLSLSACRDQDQSGDWAGEPPSEAPVAVATAAAPAARAAAPETPAPPVAEPAAEAGEGVRFVAYNVENWLTMDRYVDGRNQKGAPKPEREKQAITRLLAEIKPDVLGISEIGSEEDVKDLQAHLEQAGLKLPHAHLNRGSDTTRSLVLLSRFPIAKSVTRDDLRYSSNGVEHTMQRGILDATVDTPSGPYRFLGVHLKSKREVEEGDQADMRLKEAHLLRREIDAILREDDAARLVVYGDFNDTRNSPAVRAIHGSRNSPTGLAMIAIKDSRGHYWTHHWDFQDVYSRIDYVLVSNALKQSVDWDRCRIIDGPEVAGASDHRPLLVLLK
jgi:endonuclease/exonuclease/phosphatase family metal-dependent hydrolase